MTDKNETQVYYTIRSTVANAGKYELHRVVYQTVYGDCLKSSEELFRGTPEQMEKYLKQNGIDDVIVIGA